MTPPPINIDGTNENYSNVTIDGQDVTQITIDGQDVLSTIPDSVVSRDADSNTFSSSDTLGLLFNADEEWPDFGAKLSSNVSGVTTCTIEKQSDGTLKGQKDISSLSAGDSFVISGVNLQPNTDYVIRCDAGGGSYTVGNGPGNYPHTSSDGNLTIKGSADNDRSHVPSNSYNIVTIGDVGF